MNNAATSEFWMNLQGRYDLEIAQDHFGEKLLRAVTV
jgi:plasmid maintenance system antidote protein VapI